MPLEFMGSRFAPKPTKLEGEPTPTALEAWINNLMFNLTVDGAFEEFLDEKFTWSPSSVVNRGLVDDTDGSPKRTARQKVAYLNLMLGSIHSYADVISKRFVTEEACSLNEIWDRLRTRLGFTCCLLPSSGPATHFKKWGCSFLNKNHCYKKVYCKTLF